MGTMAKKERGCISAPTTTKSSPRLPCKRDDFIPFMRASVHEGVVWGL
jgi:hypothetical protein